MSLEKYFGKYTEYIAYAVLIGGVLFAWKTEHTDTHCPTLDSTEKECKEGGGMAFSWTQPKDGDTCQQLLDKIYKAAGAEQASVKWRKALTLSAVTMVLMWILIGYTKDKYGLPTWQVLFLSIGVSYIVLLGSYLYYSYHVYGVAEKWIRDAVKKLESDGCIKK